MGCKRGSSWEDEPKVKSKEKYKYTVISLREAILEVMDGKSTRKDFTIVEIETDDVIDIDDITVGDFLNEDDYIVLRKSVRN